MQQNSPTHKWVKRDLHFIRPQLLTWVTCTVFMRNIIPVYTQEKERNSTNSIWKISRFSSHLIQKVSLSKKGMKQGADLISHLISSRKKIDLYFDGNRTSSLFSNSILPCYPCFPTENLIRWWKICKSRYIQSSYHNEGF